ncbi:MAG: hypothetical protein RLZZ367_1294 [Bacteroidota bacterium]|jgi:predicted metal-dependent HD superfamily phosphohydrolase
MNSEQLKSTFAGVLPATVHADKEWLTIADKYNNNNRHYHTLTHLCHMCSELQSYYTAGLPVATVLALVYHDYEYNVLHSDNEKQSALYAARKLSAWGMPADVIEKVKLMIECTQQHTTDSVDTEIAIFLDADMVILGSNTETYKAYTEAVRKEFAIYPDFIYNKGRREFLKRTLSNERIFLTDYFNDKYGMQACINIQNEINSLL